MWYPTGFGIMAIALGIFAWGMYTGQCMTCELFCKPKLSRVLKTNGECECYEEVISGPDKPAR